MMNCTECKKETPDDKLLICAICKLPTCLSSSKLSVTEMRSVNLKSGSRLKYHCISCDENFVVTSKEDDRTCEGDLKNLVLDLLKIVREQNEKIIFIEKSIKEIKNGNKSETLGVSESKNRSFANIVREPAMSIKPVAEQKSAETIKEIKIKDKIDPSRIAPQPIQLNQVKTAIMQAQTTAKFKEIQSLNEDNKSEVSNEWQQQRSRQKRNRRFVVGGNSDANTDIQTVPKLISFHVTRLKPTTKPDDLKKMLVKEFPEVICEKHSSKFPDLYASMKVTIRQDNFKKAWRRDSWPDGALVSRFFVKKRMLSQAHEQMDPQA